MTCLDRIPFSAVVGFILVIAGAGVMAGTLYEALNQTETFIKRYFFPIDEIYIVNLTNLSLCGSVAFLAFILLIFGCLVTSATRNKTYREEQCVLGGRCTAGFFMIITCSSQIIWLAVVLITGIPCLCWLMMETICTEEINDWNLKKRNNPNEKFSFTFNLTNYGIYKGSYVDSQGATVWHGAINNDRDFQNLCDLVRLVGPLYSCAFAGAVCAFLGLIFLLASLSSYYTKLRLTAELTQCRRDLTGLYHPNSGIFLAQNPNYPSEMHPLNAAAAASAPHYQHMPAWQN